jgi:RNA recognition motif-containing protein
VKYSDLREKLDKKYGDIIEIEIKKDNKKQQSNLSSYAFIQFSDIKSVIKAIRCMNGKLIGNNLIKLGFGKSKPTKTLWLDNVSDQLKEAQLFDYFQPYCESNVEQILIDRVKCQALVYFGYINDAKECAEKIRARKFYDKRIMVDFASKEFISSRFEHLLDPKHHLIPTNHNRTTIVNSSNSMTTTTTTSHHIDASKELSSSKERGGGSGGRVVVVVDSSSAKRRRVKSSPHSLNDTRSSRSCSIESDSNQQRRIKMHSMAVERKNNIDGTNLSNNDQKIKRVSNI